MRLKTGCGKKTEHAKSTWEEEQKKELNNCGLLLWFTAYNPPISLCI